MKNPWFGPKTVGWGWSAITWQAWAVTVAFVAAILFVSAMPGIRYRLGIVAGLLAVYVVIVIATGTKPGGNL